MRLYARMAEYFPASPLAAESLYRAADIRWQIEAEDAGHAPFGEAARSGAAPLRSTRQYMRKVIKKYPGTKWADLAAYHLIDNKLCGDWEAEAKCPEMEAQLYMKYADDHPQSPKAPEALYKAAWRYSALIVIYKTEPAEEATIRRASTKAKTTPWRSASALNCRAERLDICAEYPAYDQLEHGIRSTARQWNDV